MEATPGLGTPKTFGDPVPNIAIPKLPLIDEVALGTPPNAADPPPVAAFPVDTPRDIVRAENADRRDAHGGQRRGDRRRGRRGDHRTGSARALLGVIRETTLTACSVRSTTTRTSCSPTPTAGRLGGGARSARTSASPSEPARRRSSTTPPTTASRCSPARETTRRRPSSSAAWQASTRPRTATRSATRPTIVPRTRSTAIPVPRGGSARSRMSPESGGRSSSTGAGHDRSHHRAAADHRLTQPLHHEGAARSSTVATRWMSALDVSSRSAARRRRSTSGSTRSPRMSIEILDTDVGYRPSYTRHQPRRLRRARHRGREGRRGRASPDRSPHRGRSLVDRPPARRGDDPSAQQPRRARPHRRRGDLDTASVRRADRADASRWEAMLG